MPGDSAIMYLVALLVGGAGVWMLLQLRRDLPERKIYAYRMVGIMAVAGGIVLAMSATAMWRWTVQG